MTALDQAPRTRTTARTTVPRRPGPLADTDRGILSVSDTRRRSVRVTARLTHTVLLVSLILVGLGPILWLAKSAITPTQDTLREPLALWPNGVDWSNLAEAWTRTDIDKFFLNTVIVAVGVWVVQVVVATTAGYALSVLRPRYGKIVSGLVLATLFVPSIVLLVPLYLTIVQPPLLGQSLINTFWAVWLPAGANAFNVLLVTRFFDSLPREVFEAARMDGAGPYRLFWSIVLPMSKPIIGVVSVFAVIGAWKDFLWPMLVLKNPDLQPLSVRLPQLQQFIELDVFLAALAISTVIPIVLFIIFQRLFLNGAGMGGAVKG
ncbi:MAG: carbohydrate ABC transporter permease [Microbacterium sp.]|jgi:multiple sugar transport system permease protein|uniref:carbohydrate ABC transporter permease n=1 Tax=Microbacterium sp. TaxID=51671 RepID=UPI0025E97731|nr:carbohydrate ABC transporter permease [Microbacterium sp.]MBQ9915579.1 carbohydrate ABC transporter permease [Microbacterium sp.]